MICGFGLFLFGFLLACQSNFSSVAQTERPAFASSDTSEKPKLAEIAAPEIRKILESAYQQIETTKNYDPAYVVIAYPNGDVPMEKGVCTDVVIRSFRNAGVDLQKEVHEDMRGNFAVYPQKWNLKSPDTNIDHRRVPNLQTYFSRKGKSLSLTTIGENYKPGDVVSWDLDGKGLTHIGLVSNTWNERTKRYSIIHNIGGGTILEDKIFDWKITGHYRYF
ncbi:MAG TPA: DUF1287 domain-containing protein [Pyrinomonadaceae bacterium]